MAKQVVQAPTREDPLFAAFGMAAEALLPKKDETYNDPVLWCKRNIDYDTEAGEGLVVYQERAMSALIEFGRVCVRGPHGLGKSTTAAHVVLWFADTRERAGKDWKVITTASVWRQLQRYLWPEIHKWERRLHTRYNPKSELFLLELKLEHGQAFAAASDDHTAIEGAHADELLYVFDEAKAIPVETWDAVEGAFSSAGKDARQKAYALAISTPGEPNGRFYEIQIQKAGYDDWHVIHVTKEEAIAAGRMSREWADQRKLQWGAKSSVYLNRVEGEFAASDADGVIPSLAWIEAAIERWHLGRNEAIQLDCVIGDIARQGADKTVLGERYGPWISELESHSQEDTVVTSQRIALKLGDPTAAYAAGIYAVVDVIGIGAGVVDQLRSAGYKVLGFHAAESTTLTDISGELTFANKRAAAWWNMRELLDPRNNFNIALPPDDDLIGELLAPKWTFRGARILVESKDDIRKRLGRSTDRADVVVMAFWDPSNEEDDEEVVYDERVEISAF